VAAVPYPSPQENGLSRNQKTVCCNLAPKKDPAQNTHKLRRCPFVGIKVKDPLGAYGQVLLSPIALCGVIFKGMLIDLVRITPGNPEGRIGTKRIDDKYRLELSVNTF
jgi:hypothetical protein